jgi:glyoxylase I family protein
MQTTILAALCCLAAFAVQATSQTQAAPARVAVRYQVKDVARSVEFYTKALGFKLGQPQSPAFAQVSSGALDVWLSGPGSSGSRVMPDGRKQEPGGWNRFVIQVTDLSARVEALKKQGVKFRNAIEVGPGGSQIQIEDPDGNPIELFQPASR